MAKDTVEQPKCEWEGSVLDYASPYGGDLDPKKAYPIHSSYRSEEETSSIKC